MSQADASIDLRRTRDLGRILDDAFSLYGVRWRRFVWVGLIIAVPVDVAILGLGLGWLWEDWSAGTARSEIAPLALAQFVVAVLLTALTIDTVVSEAEGRWYDAREGIRRTVEAFTPLLLPMLGVVAGIALGAVAFFLPAIVIAVFMCVVPQVVMVERVRGMGALRRSAELVAGRGWWVLGVQITIGLVVAIALTGLGLGADWLAEAAGARAISIVSVAIGQVVAIPLLTLVTTLLYFTLRIQKGDEQGIPGVDAWERRMTQGWRPPV